MSGCAPKESWSGFYRGPWSTQTRSGEVSLAILQDGKISGQFSLIGTSDLTELRGAIGGDSARGGEKCIERIFPPYNKLAMNFREDKATALAVYFLRQADDGIEYLKLLKLMYLAERNAILKRGVSITGDSVFSMKCGPVMSATYDLIKGNWDWINFDHETWQKSISHPSKYVLGLKEDFELEVENVLSEFEIDIAQSIWAEFKDTDQWEIVEWMHKTFPEWQDTQSRIPIYFEDILEALDLDDNEIDERIELQSQLSAFERLLKKAEKASVA